MATAATLTAQVPVQVPGLHPGLRCWAKALTGIDRSRTGGYAIEGVFLDRAATYRLPARMLVVTCERTRPAEARPVATVTLWRVDPVIEGGLALVKTWTNRSGRIGPQILKGIASRLTKDDPPRALPGIDGYRPTTPALARRGTPPSRPPSPTEADVEELARSYAKLQGVPHAERERPIELLIADAAGCGHLSAVLDLLNRLPERGDFNDRPSAAFDAIYLLYTGFPRIPF